MLKDSTQSKDDKQDLLAINLGLFSNIFLALVKISIGILASSSALISDGINSASDTVYYIITKLFLRVSAAPPDKEHPYGHRQMENITSIVVGTFILVTALLLFWSSISNAYQILTSSNPSELNIFYRISLYIALATILAKLGLYLFTKKIHKQTTNTITKALATDHLNDVLTASSATIGILATLLGYAWADPLAGAIVAIFIFYTGFAIIQESSDHLMSSIPNKELQAKIQECLVSIKEITCVDSIRVHTFGQYFVLTMTICINGDLSIQAGDDIASKLDKTLHQKLPKLLAVHIHYHPKG